MVDNLAYTVSTGDSHTFNFDLASDIDNGNTTDDATVHNVRATGKPPSLYFHAHPINGDLSRSYDALQWNDICGSPSAAIRFCNMDGVVMSVGNHDYFEGPGGAPTGAAADANGCQGGMYSPTINLVSANDTDFNGMGINKRIATASDDYYVWYDIYTGTYDLFNKGNAWTYGFQAYPATQDVAHNSAKCWGERRHPAFQIFNPDVQCLPDIEPARFYSLLATSNSGLVPDSLRVYLGNNQQCYRFPSVTVCPNLEGGYFDNVSVLLASKPGGNTATVAMDIWQFTNDAFPINDGTSPDPNVATFPGTARFDTCGAKLTIGLNNARLTANPTRLTIPGDTMAALERWDWPGNIRELENVIERAVILSNGPVLQVPSAAIHPPRARHVRSREAHRPPRLRDAERETIVRALRESNGVVAGPAGAAARLGVKRTTLQSKMRKLGITRPGY